jgi:hypothetical protein
MLDNRDNELSHNNKEQLMMINGDDTLADGINMRQVHRFIKSDKGGGG